VVRRCAALFLDFRDGLVAGTISAYCRAPGSISDIAGLRAMAEHIGCGWETRRGAMTNEGDVGLGVARFSTGDPEDFAVLHDELRGVPGVRVEAVAAPVAPGVQGPVLEFLTVACSGGAITVVLQIVKALVESRGPKFSLKIRRGKDRLEITADSVDEALPLLRDLLDGS
jgi:hypothetical protein